MRGALGNGWERVRVTTLPSAAESEYAGELAIGQMCQEHWGETSVIARVV